MTTTKQYRNLGKRVENTACGKLGRIARAVPRTDVKRGWEIWIAWDDGHDGAGWTDRDIGKSALNRIVPDDYAPNHGPIPDRIRALLAVLDKGGIEWRYGMITSVSVGRDSIGIWRPFRTFVASAHLWAGQGKWEGESDTQENAWNALRIVLLAALKHND
jgi:hypothetical protein